MSELGRLRAETGAGSGYGRRVDVHDSNVHAYLLSGKVINAWLIRIYHVVYASVANVTASRLQNLAQSKYIVICILFQIAPSDGPGRYG